MSFVHLHCHTISSRLDGMIDPVEYVDYCIEHGMPAATILDHGNLGATIPFYIHARERGLNPIIGQEIYLVEDHTTLAMDSSAVRYHESVLAQSFAGYQNLVHLSSLGFTDGLHLQRFPCVDDEQLARYSGDLLVLSGCISSRLARTILGGLTAQQLLVGGATRAITLSRDSNGFADARRAARTVAQQAAQAHGTKKTRLLEEAKKQHAFLDQVSELVAKDGLSLWYDEQMLLARQTWEQAWRKAEQIVEKRVKVFGDRYYLETQIAPSEDQQTLNTYVRKLSEATGIKCVVTADAHYLRKEDADRHRMMLRVRTDKKPKTTEKRAAAKYEFNEKDATAILAGTGDVEELEVLYDAITAELVACAGKKMRTDTKAYAERRKRWVTHAQIFYLQSNGAETEASDLEVTEEDVSVEAIDPGRPYSEWMAEFWVRTPEEMLAAGALPEEMQNTVDLAARCDIRIPVNDGKTRIVHMPNFPLPEEYQQKGWGQDEYLAELCNLGLREYLDANPTFNPAPYHAELALELQTIQDSGFSNYFLIVRDYINAVREHGGLTGPGRGSAAASLVTFLLGITRVIDPLKYSDLMFERFLTPGRPDLPDIDTDFDFDSAAWVYEYCKQKYGAGKVCKIGTFSKIGARQALQDVGRVLGIPYTDSDRATKILQDFRPEEDQVAEDNKALFKLEEVAELIPDLAKLRDLDEDHKLWFKYANELQGTQRNASQHASGVAIADQDLISLGVPLQVTVSKGEKVLTTQYDMDDLAVLGIPKFDQLKLSNLNIIAEAERLIGDDFSITEIPLEDSAVYTRLSMGDNLGIFQVAQNKVRGVLRAVQPRRLADLAAVITIIRPGLFAKDKESGLTQEELYKARRSGSLPVRFQFPFLAEILSDTQGIMIYQEQVLKVCWATGMSKLDADKLRKVLSKKQMSKAREFRDKFIPGAQSNLGLTEQEANDLWDLVVEFAAYGFNAAHAYSYGLIAYWTSYLKTHYPAQFMAATLSVLSTKNTKAAKELIPKLLEDCNQMGRDLPILAPCVNTSEDGFKVEYASTDSGLVPGLRYGLAGVRGVGSLADAILVERSAGGLFTDLQSFDSRLHQRLGRRPSRTALEALAYAGAFDSFFTHRSEALHHVQILREETKYKREELIRLGWQPERSALLAQKQAELCGNYYFVRDNLEVLGREVDNFFEAVKDDRITVGGRVVDAKLDKKTKKGSTYHRVTLKTQWGNVTVDFYAPWKSKDPNQYLADLRAKLFQGSVILVEGSVRDERTMWGYSVKLPKAQYQGVSTEPPAQLQQEANEALYTREQFTVFTAPAAFE